MSNALQTFDDFNIISKKKSHPEERLANMRVHGFGWVVAGGSLLFRGNFFRSIPAMIGGILVIRLAEDISDTVNQEITEYNKHLPEKEQFLTYAPEKKDSFITTLILAGTGLNWIGAALYSRSIFLTPLGILCGTTGTALTLCAPLLAKHKNYIAQKEKFMKAWEEKSKIKDIKEIQKKEKDSSIE